MHIEARPENPIVTQFREWASAQEIAGTTRTVAGDKIAFEAEWATAHCDIYQLQMDIVSLSIMDPDDEENKFFLHFELTDLERAKELFGEMAERMCELADERPVRVLLSCTSALTTSFFANKLNQIAQTLSLGFEFDAVPVAQAIGTGFHRDVVLLAPQASYAYDNLAEFLDDKIVRNIPPKIFATYDTSGLVEFVRHEVAEEQRKEALRAEARAVERIRSSARVLTLSVSPFADQTRIDCRMYVQGDPVWRQVVQKRRLEPVADIADILATAPVSAGIPYDVVGIAVPAIARNGIVDLGDGSSPIALGPQLEERFGVPVIVTNSVNAAALGYYLQQDSARDILLVSMRTDHIMAGQGVVIDGKLRLGAHHVSGEMRYLMHRVLGNSVTDLISKQKSDDKSQLDLQQLLDLMTLEVQAAISSIDPEVVCIYSDIAPDAKTIRDELALYMPERYVPEIVRIRSTDLREFSLLGQMSIALSVYERRESAAGEARA